MIRKKRANSVLASFALALLAAPAFGDVAVDRISPDPAITPGAVIAGVAVSDLCRHGYTAEVRNVPASLKRQVFIRYGIDPARSAAFEVDHLISLELGGSNAIENLWPEPYEALMGAHIKDKLENRLHRLVCAGTLSLEEAQRAIAGDWQAAYRLYMPQ